MELKKYSNGLRLIVNENNSTNVVAFKIFVDVGSKDEGVGEFGYAHFLEHMFFRSTKNYKQNESLKLLDGLGVSKNAYTGINHTCYYFKCISSVLEEVIKIFSNMFFNLDYDKQEILNEKNVIIQEYKMGKDDYEKQAIENALLSMFKNTPLGHSPIGTPSTIKKVTSNKLKEFKQKHYLPEKVVISVSGAVNSKQIQQLIQTYFVSEFNNKATNHQNPIKEIACSKFSRYITFKHKTQQTNVAILYNLKELTKREQKTYDLLFAILGRGMSSKLFEEVREKMGAVYHISAVFEKLCNNHFGEIFFSTSPQKVKDTLMQIKSIIEQVANGDVTQDELQRVKNQVVTAFEYSRETNSSIAEINGTELLEENKILNEQQEINEYNKITTSQISECAKRLLKNNEYVVCAVGDCNKTNIMVY